MLPTNVWRKKERLRAIQLATFVMIKHSFLPLASKYNSYQSYQTFLCVVLSPFSFHVELLPLLLQLVPAVSDLWNLTARTRSLDVRGKRVLASTLRTF